MSNSKHTPAMTYYADSGTIVEDSRVVVLANLYGDSADTLGPIFAAAPDLLAALRELTGVLMEQQDELAAAGIACVPEIESARAAIAKAEGQS
jgi:hypothetical protein